MNNYEKEYKYTCEIELVGHYDKVLSIYFDRSRMMEWNEGLTRIEDINKSQFNLIFDLESYQMKMEVHILEYDPPHYARSVYEVPGVWNQCIDKFEKVQDKIIWTMEVEFRFAEDPNLLIDEFISKTYAGMKVFKNYFENL